MHHALPLRALRARILAPGISVLLAACAHAPERSQPQPTTPAPETFVDAEVVGAITPEWVDAFGDETLSALIAEAWAANPSLIVTAARLEQARARAAQAGARRLPEVSAVAGAGRSRSNLGDNAIYRNDYDVGLSVSWEADVWGRLAAAARAGAADAAAAEADLVAAHQSLAAQVAQAWFLVTHDQLQLKLSRDFLSSATTTANLLAKRFAHGRSPAVDVRAARAQAARAEVDVAGRRKNLQSSRRDLELLLGRYPAAAVDGAQDLATVPDPLPAGLPAELLLRRPDLQASAARLLASDERLASAEADLLPRISLTAGGGYRSNELEDLISPQNLVWNLVANLVAPLFDGGRRDAVVDEREAQVRELAATYAGQAMRAFREVEGSLAVGEILRDELVHQRIAAEESRQVVIDLRGRYAEGLTDGIILLAEQRNVLTRDKEMLALRLLALFNRIDLHLALGGSASATQSQAIADILTSEED